MALQVVDRDERQLAPPGQRLGGRQPDEQRTDQPRALSDGDRLDVVQARLRLAERLSDHRQDELEVVPRGDLRHDPAEARVQVGLRGNDVGAELSVTRQERRRRLVAGGLEPENHALSLRESAS